MVATGSADMSYLMGKVRMHVCHMSVSRMSVTMSCLSSGHCSCTKISCCNALHNCSKGFCLAMTNANQPAAVPYNIGVCMSLVYQVCIRGLHVLSSLAAAADNCQPSAGWTKLDNQRRTCQARTSCNTNGHCWLQHWLQTQIYRFRQLYRHWA